MKKLSLFFFITLSSLVLAQNQKHPALTNKPGTFEILSRTDYFMPDLGFTKADATANLKRIVDLVGIVRQNPVQADIKGFMGRARISTYCFPNHCDYALPSILKFEFSDYLYSNGKVVFNTIEPPVWEINVNVTSGSWNGFNTAKCMFTMPVNKKIIAPGIDVYDDVTYVIYDPNRPPYWVPVTMEEAFACAREEAKKEKDETSAKYLNEFMEKEWAVISRANLKNQAYLGGGISRVSDASGFEGEKNLFPPIVKVNPEYWNKNLPKSAIQFIVLTISMDKKYLQSEFESCLKLKYYGETCNLQRFQVS